ncbi:Gmad2 immunoglobulin-like domain-containing protein [Thermoflexus sp.]|uniref:Gmad2 immunoglobulin-like domain-containing protein n=1 Tax=Thermoflexus sp. TaxID=1969742 RepID=UPI0025D064AC|nr:Gmad2 immunoglobulin-like domain-containing protein [Thermoflexus sp.]MDW8179539.1 Gmad2 immunoglobulin-like domain-containing protein [Anaerolineae bacterium]MCS6962795.1 Gmad2 immunoglobulin-like domain-containing protein [Thermoflexus sp.]MCS7350090.1 Gmad2 immunoglobulin-like domain-containing protein [Thermoflexus sp.]MCX7689454.1 Gmad2 immunoglobulin-like domain-containing protein [Thermoflexus sp.]MDW8184729.1 Gmad2 immunoglobulin-like domain-containing protein [Anaerolineae bacteriu
MPLTKILFALMFVGLISACSPATVESPRASAPGKDSATPVATPSSAALTRVPPPSPSSFDGWPEEAIWILQPGPGSRVASPLRIAGIADPTFEQHLIVRLVLDDAEEPWIERPVIIASDVGKRGPFEVEIPFAVDRERQAFLQVYATSPRDGGITHLSTAGILLIPGGPSELRPPPPSRERILIQHPVIAQRIRGGVVVVQGIGVARFEQTLVAELLDEEGDLLGARTITLDAADPGHPAPFRVEIPYRISRSGPGRVVVRDPSPAFAGDFHRTSVEVWLEP